jgi:hypothetical protein
VKTCGSQGAAASGASHGIARGCERSRWTRVLEEIAHLRFLVAAVQRQVDEARAQAAQVEEQRFGRFFDLHRDAVAGLEPARGEEPRVAGAHRVRVAVGDTPEAV